VAFDRFTEERAALEEADGLVFFCDAGIVALANTLLGTLAGFATIYPDWRRTLALVVGEAAAVEAAQRAGWARARFGLGEPIGAVPHGTRFFGEVYVEERHHRRALAVQLLAATGRLVQAARGDDRCIVVLSAEHLDAVRLGLPDRPVGLDR
jgi:hypothetical protein